MNPGNRARLQWGDVHLMPDGASANLSYRIEASANGTDWGNPEAVVTAVESRLQDGSLAVVDSYQNRQAPIYLRVTAATYDALAAGEAALVAETRKSGYNTLTWTPNELLAVPSVFDVVYSVLNFAFDDVAETMLKRRFIATLTCLPFPRSATEVIATAIPAPPVSETKVNIADGSVTTGWTATYVTGGGSGPATVTSAGGQVQASTPSTIGGSSVTMKFTGTISSLGTTPYILVDWKVSGGGANGSSMTGNGGTVPLTKVAEGASPTAGYTRTYFQPPAGTTSLTDVAFLVNIVFTAGSTVRTLFIDTLDRTDTPPASGTRRQLLRSLPVSGAVRTQGRLSVQHETSSLGEVLVYTYKNDASGYSPPLRPFYFAGGTVTSDVNLVSGGSNMLDTLVEYRVPAVKLVAGNHRLYAKLKGNSAGAVTLNIAAYTRVGSTDVPGTITFSATVTVATTWGIFDLGGLSLPATLVPSGTSATVRITIVDADTSGIDVDLDEAWLFNLDIGALTHVDCGTGTPAAGGPAKRLWLDPATVTNDGQDAIFIGHSTDRTDAFNPATAIKGWTPPQFEPTSMNVLTVCTNALDVAVELRHYPRFLHNARAVP